MGTRSAQNQNVTLDISATITNTLGDGGTAQASIAPNFLEASLDAGVSAGQANRAWEEIGITITSGNTLDINLRTCGARDIGAGTGNDAVGQSVLHEEIVCLAIYKTGGAGSLEINPTLPTSPLTWLPLNTAVDALGGAIKTGGLRIWYDDDTDALDTSPTAANVRFKAVDGDVTFNIYVLGRHDDDESSSSSSSSTSSSSSSTSSTSSSSTSSTST